MVRGVRLVLIVAALALGLAGCSLLLDFGGELTDAAIALPDARPPDAAPADAAPADARPSP